LVGYTPPSPTAYGAFFFKTVSSGSLVTSTSITSISIQNSLGSTTNYTAGVDFGATPNTIYVYDNILACYGLQIINAAMRTLFADSSTAITSPSLKPLDASSGFGASNPSISVSTSGSSYNNQTGVRGASVSKSGASYILEFGSANTTFSNSFSVTSLFVNINGSPSSYFNSSDFNVSFAENTANGRFTMFMTVSNATLQTLLNNSFLS
jgi:hypothetical protein